MNTEKRRLPRLPLDVEVNYLGKAFAHSKDISEGGLCLISEEALKPGDFITLLFHLPPDGEKISAYGKVMWNKKVSENMFESGVNFWDIKDIEY